VFDQEFVYTIADGTASTDWQMLARVRLGSR
jgi:hypothetical protein